MLKKTITYTDYNGVERTEDKYFNLNKAEVVEMELSEAGGWAATVERIIAAQDAASLVSIFKDVIFRSYGEKSPDGKRFIKSEELSIAFSQTEAYSKLFLELALDAEKAAEFMNGILPDNMEDELKKIELKKLAAEKLGVTQ